MSPFRAAPRRARTLPASSTISTESPLAPPSIRSWSGIGRSGTSFHVGDPELHLGDVERARRLAEEDRRVEHERRRLAVVLVPRGVDVDQARAVDAQRDRAVREIGAVTSAQRRGHRTAELHAPGPDAGREHGEQGLGVAGGVERREIDPRRVVEAVHLRRAMRVRASDRDVEPAHPERSPIGLHLRVEPEHETEGRARDALALAVRDREAGARDPHLADHGGRRIERDAEVEAELDLRGLDDQRGAHPAVEIVEDHRERGADHDQEHAEPTQEPPGPSRARWSRG
ncbi:MAG: hypothetical protein ABJE95_28455, partial [Byssovorax sp.]